MNIDFIMLVARNEMKLLRRNWLFIFFVFLTILGLILLQSVLQHVFPVYHFYALSCSIPFINTYLFNLFQSFFLVFIAGNYIYRDCKLDSLDAILVRPYSNLDYLIGKWIAIISLFITVYIINLIILGIFHIGNGSYPFTFFPYLFYLLTLALPVLLFVTGLTVWLNVVFKTPFLSMFILFGYILVDVFYLSDIQFGCFDFLAMTIPNVFSDIVGHVGVSTYLLQRFAYILFGISFLFFAVSRLQRLAGSIKDVRRCILLGIILFGIGVGCGWSYYWHYYKINQKRKQYIALYEEYKDNERIRISEQKIVYKQEGEWISVLDSITVYNPNKKKIKDVILYLNPSLTVNNVTCMGEKVHYRKNEQVLLLDYPIGCGEYRNFVIHYSGKIDESVCYLDVDDSEYNNTKWSNSILRYGKRTAMVEEAYTFLTPECLWYPVCAPLVNPVQPLASEISFSNYSLTVVHDTMYTVISQGKPSRSREGSYFKNTNPLPGLTLCMGKYNCRSLLIDSTLFEIYFFNEGNNFLAILDGSQKGVVEGIRGVKEKFEYKYGIKYPFSKMTLVEIPVSLCSYSRIGKEGSEFVQPELVFQPENWCKNSQYVSMKNYTREMEKMRPMQSVEVSEKEKISSWSESYFNSLAMEFPKMDLLSFLSNHQLFLTPVKNMSSVAFWFTNFTGCLYSDKYPYIDYFIRQMLMNNRVQILQNSIEVGSTKDDSVIDYLSSHSLQNVLSGSRLSSFEGSILKLKSQYFAKYIYCHIDQDEFKAFLVDFYSRNLFREVPFEQFVEEVQQKFHFDFLTFVEEFYRMSGVPFFFIRNLDQKIMTEGQFCETLVSFDVWNPSECNGVVTLYSEGDDYTPDLQEVKSIPVYSGTCIHVSVPMKKRKWNILLHTNFSQNNPDSYFKLFSQELKTTSDSFMEIVSIDTICFTSDKDEILVDNEDDMFCTTMSESRETWLSKLLHQNIPKYGMMTDFLQGKFSGWLPSVFNDAIGEPVRSFCGKVVKNGTGKATWKALLPEDGDYELYVYQLGLNHRFQYQVELFSYCYSVEQKGYKANIRVDILPSGTRNVFLQDNEGRDEDSTFDMQIFESRWIFLGKYKLSKGEISISLLDRGAFPGQLIFADAVKWVKRR